MPPVSTDRTIARLWRDAVAQERVGAAYLVQHGDHWHEVTWAEAAERVENLANGLLARGVQKGEAFATLARTALEWALFDFALAQVGAVGAPIYANSSPKDVAYVLDHSESVGVLCEDAAQVAKVDEERASLPRLRHVLTFDDLPALEAEGASFKAEHPSALADAVAAIDEEDLFTLLYTSGTTGPPKGCMIRHRNYYTMVSVIDHLPDYVRRDDLMLLYLPLAHNFGRLMHLTGPYVGYTIAFLPDPLQTAAALMTVRPTVLPSVPRVYEKIHTAVVGALDETTGAKRRLADWSLAVGREVSKREEAGLAVGGLLQAKHRVADRLVFSKIRDRLGGRLRTPISGGAPLVQEIAEFFDAIGIRILEGYGLSECTTAATTNTPERWRFGTVGPALPGFELRIANDGELLIRSDTVFGGYYKDPAETAEVLGADGWLRTGDIAEIDADGFVTITDRKKARRWGPRVAAGARGRTGPGRTSACPPVRSRTTRGPSAPASASLHHPNEPPEHLIVEVLLDLHHALSEHDAVPARGRQPPNERGRLDLDLHEPISPSARPSLVRGQRIPVDPTRRAPRRHRLA